MNTLRTACVILLTLFAVPAMATDYYVHPETGDDGNAGSSVESPWKSLDKVNATRLKAGDSVLLAAGQVLRGSLKLDKVKGTQDAPVTVSSYGEPANGGRATIDARGFRYGVHVRNSSHVKVSDLEITADGGGVRGKQRGADMRAGVFVQLTRRGKYNNIHLDNLRIHDVFYEDPGVSRSAAETRSAFGTQRYGRGIRVFNQSRGAVLTGLTITNNRVENVSHTGIQISGGQNQGVRNIRIHKNRVIDSGGPGMQSSRVRDMTVSENVINGSGSIKDSRNWGRGSGMWTWGTSDVLVERNAFMNANGPGDSAGFHIDFNCSNVVIQHNLSANNAGGFVEILGNNYNNTYRYNVSINDGHRVKGENGAFQEGKTFWLSGYVGKNREQRGPFNSYFYNNTIFVDKGIVSKVAVSPTARGVLIANNIFYVEGESEAVRGDQYNPARGRKGARNVVFENNLFLRPDNWPDGTGLADSAPIIGDPGFAISDAMNIRDLTPQNVSLVKDAGISIENIPGDEKGLPGGLDVTHDILGNPITGKPDMGAIEVSERYVEQYVEDRRAEAALDLSGEVRGYELVWSDEFETDGRLNPADWTYETGFVRNQELQWYQPDNAYRENGMLVIEGRRETVRNPDWIRGSWQWNTRRKHAAYTSASVTTKDRHSWRYGRFEIRARVKTDAGLWPAIWFLGDKGGWPSNGEIDLMEYYDGMVLANAAWGAPAAGGAEPIWDVTRTPLTRFDEEWQERFHVWRMDWNESRIDLFLDDVLLNSIDVEAATNPEGVEPRYPFRQPQYLLLNLALGSKGGDPAKTEFPTRYEIDYVRVYQNVKNGEVD